MPRGISGEDRAWRIHPCTRLGLYEHDALGGGRRSARSLWRSASDDLAIQTNRDFACERSVRVKRSHLVHL